jgi:hypothetical protein
VSIGWCPKGDGGVVDGEQFEEKLEECCALEFGEEEKEGLVVVNDLFN